MKPIHLAALGAALAVAAALFFALGDDGSRTGGRTRATRDTPVRRPVDFDEYVPTEPPAPGTTYELRLAVTHPDGTPAGGARIDLQGRSVRGAKADAGGHVHITGLEPGHYDLWARSGNAVGALGFELQTDRDLGALTLRIAVAVRGHVFDLNKQPLAGATVEAVKMYAGEASWFNYSQRLLSPDTVSAQARSGSDGAYEILLPGKGLYGLRALAVGYAAEVESTRNYSRAKRGIDFYLAPGRALEGRVLDEEDSPIGGARVVAAVSLGRPGDLAPKAQAVTTPDGSFRVTVPNADRLQLSVTAAGYAKYVNPLLQLTGREIVVRLKRGIAVRMRTIEKATQRPIENVEVTILHQGGQKRGRSNSTGDVVIENLPTFRAGGGGGLTALVVAPEHVPLRISLRDHEVVGGVLDVGAVELETGGVVRGTVRDKESGRPIGGAVVKPFGGRSVRLSMMLRADVHADDDGRYELRGVALDAATVIALHDDYVMDMDRNTLIKNMRGGGLFDGETKEATVDIDLVPAKAVRGVVVGPNGAPVAGARVQTAIPLATSLSRLLGGEDPSAISDQRGRFALGGLKRDESAVLLATHRDYGSSARVDAVAGGSDVTLRLESPLLIRGTVLDESRRPIKGVRVSVAPRQREPRRGSRGNARPGYTDEAGAFAIRNAPSGELTLSFDHRGYAVVRKELVIDGGNEVHDVGKITLSRGPGIEVLVMRVNGSPFPGVRVNATWAGRPFGVGGNRTRPEGRTWGNAVSDEDGHASIHGLAEGPFRLTAAGSRHFSDKPVVQTGSRAVRLVVREAATLRGRVVADGKGVAGAWLRVYLKLEVDETTPDWTNVITSTRTNKAGSFTLVGLPPDATFDVTITHPGHMLKSVLGVTTGIERQFVLDTGGRIAGVVVDAGGPIRGAAVRIFLSQIPIKWGRTDRDGRFAFSGIGNGDLEAEVQRTPTGHIPSGRVPIESGNLDIRIEVKRGLTISGKVVLKSDVAGSGFMIEVIGSDGKTAGSAWVTKTRPTFSVGGLPHSTYTVRALRWIGAGEREVVAELPGVGAGSGDIELEIE